MAVEPIRAWAQRETMRRTTAERLDGSSSSGSSSSRALGAADRGLGLLQEGGSIWLAQGCVRLMQVTDLAKAGMSQSLAGLFLEAHPDPTVP